MVSSQLKDQLIEINRPLVHVHTTEEILKDLLQHIERKEPFSTIRYGDAVFGMVASFFCPGLITVGKWRGRKGRKFSNTIMGQLTIPKEKREAIMRRVVRAADNANYCDCFDAYYYLDTKKGVGIIGRKWKEIHETAGITNENYCNPYVHYFSIVEGELNILNVIKGRKVFCISNNVQIANRLKRLSGALSIETYMIPRRGRTGKHFRKHYEQIMSFIRNNAKKYDVFLIGAGLLGKVYCDEIKRRGGIAYDSGRLFDLWAGTRKIDSRPKRFIKMDKTIMLCRRIKKHPSGIW